MFSPPPDRFAFGLRFICGMLFFGPMGLLLGLRFTSELSMPTVLLWALFSVGLSLFVARAGDEGWRRLVDFLKWW